MSNHPFASDEELEMVFKEVFLLFRDVVNAAKCDVPENDIREYAAGLVVKIFRQICSFKLLEKGSPAPYDDPTQVNWDYASITCITRSILEAYLIYHWIFIDSDSSAEQEFKYFAWIMGSLINRLEIYPIDVYDKLNRIEEISTDLPDIPQIFKNDRKEIENIREKLKKNNFYLKEILPLSKSEKRRERYEKMIREGWYPSGWKHLQEAIPTFHNKRAHQMLSNTVHSGYLHIRQINRAKTGDEQRKLSKVESIYITMVMARLSLEYVEIFPHAAEAYDRHKYGLALAKQLSSKE